ncbi:adenosylcobinamide-GDP ribazoletransferase [Ornithinimicrobium sp. Y1694]|uniref:adenosylcobinamide-GDP ribazoletransferase n=1 Tax=Ornithinimicrobium sp. Y1694 TaxID=3418590 RepID=UPI003CE719A8
MSLLDAVAFLTRVPVPVRERFDLARAAWAFPVVGALVGLVVGGVAVAGSLVLPPLVASVLAVAAGVLLTGALHLDGLADCADSCGGRDREARLRIMKDSSVGVYGVAAVVLDLLLLVALVQALVVALPWASAVVVLAGGYAVSRAAILPVALWLPSARPSGTGGVLTGGLQPAGVVVAVIVAVVLVMVGALVWTPLAVVLVGGGVGALIVALWARQTLGGVTGDVFGAVVEISLLGALLAAALALRV